MRRGDLFRARRPGGPAPEASAVEGRQRSRDLLASTVADIESLIGSRTRALAVRRFLIERTPPNLPERVGGIAQPAWDVVRDGAFFSSCREVSRMRSEDGTVKLALRLGDAAVETVLIPARGRGTVCVSSQAGCTRRCDFCATARLGVGRNLRAGEIVAQYLAAAGVVPECAPRNVVFMGMGEPLDNLDAVLGAVRSLSDVYPGLASHRVTVSTAGVLPGIKRFLAECDANLALSLNATTDALRTRLMPHNARWPIQSLLGLLREESERQPARRFFIEYVLLAGVNDTPGDASRLAQLLRGIAAQVNVIPHNSFDGSPYVEPTREATLRFQQKLKAHGIRSIVRWPRGADAAAACGQLALGSFNSAPFG